MLIQLEVTQLTEHQGLVAQHVLKLNLSGGKPKNTSSGRRNTQPREGRMAMKEIHLKKNQHSTTQRNLAYLGKSLSATIRMSSSFSSSCHITMKSLHEILRIAANQEQIAVGGTKSCTFQLNINSKVSKTCNRMEWANTTQCWRGLISKPKARSMGPYFLPSCMLVWFMNHNNFSITGKWNDDRQLTFHSMLAAV